MTRTFACSSCEPGCRLETDEDDIYPPSLCPWPNAGAEAAWEEAA